MAEPIHDSLLQAALSVPNFQEKHKDETDQDYFHRLAEAISQIPEDLWLALSEEAKQWYDSALGDDNDLKAELAVPAGYTPPAPATPTRRRVATPTKQTTFQIVQELAGGDPRHSDESDQEYLSRLLADLPEAIPTSIHEWVGAADQAAEQDKPVPLPDGFVPTDKIVHQPEAPGKHTNGSGDHKYVGEDGEPLKGIQLFNARLAAGEVTRRPRKAGPPKEAPVKVAKPRGARRTRTVRADSTTAMIRVAVTQNPDISVEELQSLLKEHGKDTAVSTITTTRASHLAALRAIESCGWTPPASAAD